MSKNQHEKLVQAIADAMSLEIYVFAQLNQQQIINHINSRNYEEAMKLLTDEHTMKWIDERGCTKILKAAVHTKFDFFQECFKIFLAKGARINLKLLEYVFYNSGQSPNEELDENTNVSLLIKHLLTSGNKIDRDVIDFFISKPGIIISFIDLFKQINLFSEKHLLEIFEEYKLAEDNESSVFLCRKEYYKVFKLLLEQGISTVKLGSTDIVEDKIIKNYIIQAREISKLFGNQKTPTSAKILKKSMDELAEITGFKPDFELIIGRFNSKLAELIKKNNPAAERMFKQKLKDSGLSELLIDGKSIGQILFENSPLKNEFKDIESYLADNNEYSAVSSSQEPDVSKEISKEKAKEHDNQFFKQDENDQSIISNSVNSECIHNEMLLGSDPQILD